MNGFDFDSLRDPYAPQPGPEQREGVEMRAQELRAIARRKSTLLSALAVIVVIAAAGAVFAATRSDKHQVVVRNTTTTKAPTTSTSKPTPTTKPGVIASSTTTTTTTTPPTPKPINGPVLSASFVSPEHGWALKKNGEVEETTDGGVTWKGIGSVGTVRYGDSNTNPQIRFANASIGFMHDDVAFLETVDGGVTWKVLDTPFQALSNMTVSRGVVYDVAYDGATQDFALWSSAVDPINWHQDTVFSSGAGPVPLQELAFSGASGWAINEDRTVIGGQRTVTDVPGHWQAWTPPCLGVNGPARLAASSEADLVASCHDNEWGGNQPPTASVWFSHDGGASFTRQPAPGYGIIASPNRTTAVVAEFTQLNSVLWRTTDSGVSWHEVAHEPAAYAALDIGFTTSRQGFVVFDDGTMLMTYDAGATWSAVTNP